MSKIIGKRPPTEKTPGILGQEYIDSTTGKTYVCTHVNYGAVNDEPAGEIEGRYTWEEGSGGGASSWNDLADKPFGEVAIKVDTVTWNGNTEGLEYALSRNPTTLYRVSDSVPTLDDIKNGLSIGRSWTESVANYTEETLLEYYELYGVITNSYDDFFIIPTDNYRIAYNGYIHTFPKAGVYLYEQKGEYFNYVTIPGYTGFENGSDTLTWDGNIDGLDNATTYQEPYFFYISDNVLTIDDVQNGVNIVMADDSVTNVSHDSMLEIYNETGIITDEFNSFCIAPSDNYVLVDEVFGATTTFPKAGLYVYSPWDVDGRYVKSITFPGCNIFDGVGVKQIDPKYIKDMYYETKKTEYILENFNLGDTYHHAQGNMKCPLDPVVNFDNLEDGQKCYLDFNGTIYEGIFISSGNPRMNFENVEFNGKTFPISVSADDVTMSNAYMPDNSVWSTENISVYVEVVDVHGIDPKYLGDVNAHFEAIHSEINGRFTPVYEILNSLNTTYCTKDELAELCTKDELAELCTKDELAEIMGSYINDIDTLVGGDS